MTSKRNARPRHSRCLILACTGTLACAPARLPAQEGTPPASKLEKIEVTGSRIARIEGESGLPVQVITREELLDGGVQTMQDLLDRVSANQSFGAFSEAKGEGNTIVGFTAASLRGLGSQRTLVLMNGRRLAPYALSGGQSVDLSGIPAAVIERVEILKDGASAVYGTDAIGGVINFVLRKTFQGAEAGANAFWTQQGGGDNRQINGTLGFGDLATDKYNFFVAADYLKQDALKASQRAFSKTAYLPALGLDRTSINSFPANIAQIDFSTGESYGFSDLQNPTILFPAGAGPKSCAPPYSFPTQMSPFICGFDYASVIETIPESEKANVIGRLTLQIDPESQLFAEATYYNGRFAQRVSPTPVAAYATSTPMTLPPTSPYYPASYVASLPGGEPTQPLQILGRTIELGPRTDRATVDQGTAVAGLTGKVSSWDYQLAASYAGNRQRDDLISGYVSEARFGPLLRSGIINPFGPNTAAVLEMLRAAQATGQANDNRASNYGADLSIANTLYKLPAGPIGVALGFEGRREKLEQQNSDFIETGDIIGGNGAVPSLPASHRNVWSLFGEVNAAVVKGVEANIAVRYDHYSDFGGTTNPKLTLRWQPSRVVLFRGAYGAGFRAPTLSDLFQPQSVAFTETNFSDPIRCPVTGSPTDCLGLTSLKSGGNPALRPERSRQVNAGFVIEPAKALSASIDYYRAEVRNVIEIVPIDTIFGNYARWAPGYVVRKPPDPEHPDLPGPIDYIVQYSTNVGTITTSGIDVNVQWRSGSTPAGKFALSLDGTYVIHYAHSGFESAAIPPGVGTRGPDGAIIRYRHYAQANWTLGPWGATLANAYQDGYSEVDLLTCEDPGRELDCSGKRRVGAYSVWDLQGRYEGIKNTALTLGIRNLFNRPPPVSNQGSLSGDFQAGYDPTYADPRGRMYYVALRYTFR